MRISFKVNGEIKSSSDKQKLGEFSTTSFTTNVKGTYILKKFKGRKLSTKSNPSNEENSKRNIYINNYLKCKWVKCSTQKTQTS